MSQPVSQSSNGGVKYLYMAATFVVVVAGLRAAESIINPLLLAIFLSVVSAPAYFELLRRGISEWLALLTVMAVLGILTLGVVFMVTQSIASFTSQQEFYREQLKEKRIDVMRAARSWLPDWKSETSPAAAAPEDDMEQPADENQITVTSETVTEQETDEEANVETSDKFGASADPEDMGEDADTDATEQIADDADSSPVVPRALRFPTPHDQLPDNEKSWTEYMSEQFDPGTAISLAASIAGSIGQLLSNAILILLTVVFILLEAGSFNKKLGDAVQRSDEARERASHVVSSLRHYFVIKTWVSLVTGVLVAIWLWMFNVSHAPLWGLLAFMFNYIPNVGSFLAAIPAILVAWLEVGALPAVASAVGFVLVNVVIGNFIEPRLLGKGLGLSPLIVFCSMVFWGWVLGPVGMLLSVPLTMTARIVMDGFDDTKWIATLMGNAET